MNIDDDDNDDDDDIDNAVVRQAGRLLWLSSGWRPMTQSSALSPSSSSSSSSKQFRGTAVILGV